MPLKHINRIFGGSLLVAGTCIGAGMLGLPVATAAGGFSNTIGLFIICWLFMVLTALFMLEVSLWFPGETNLISMSSQTLGKTGARLAWIFYVLFLYALIVAYTVGGAAIFQHAVEVWWPGKIPSVVTTTVFTVVFAGVVYLGARWVDRVNRLLMLGLIAGYSALIILIAPDATVQPVGTSEAPFLLAAVPLTVTSFGFHLLIPSLKTYMQDRIQEVRLTIILGSLLPLIVYGLWVYVIVGVIPAYGKGGLIEIAQQGEPVPHLLQALDRIVGSSWVSLWSRIFGLFALLSSFIGVALGLFDFFADGLKIKKNRHGKWKLVLLTFGIPYLCAVSYPKGFLQALGYAGIFAAILLIIYPAWMVLRGRALHKNTKTSYRVFGGRFLPMLALTFGFLVIGLELMQQWKYLPVPIDVPSE